MAAVSIGLVGAGGIAASMHLPALLAMPQCRIAWIMDSAPERSRALARLFDLPAVAFPAKVSEIPACDAVLLALPLPPRALYFDALLPTDMAILAEKPLMTTAAEHRRLVADYEPWRISVGYQRRQYASSRMLRSIVAGGGLGRLIAIEAREGGRITRTGGHGGYMDLSVAQGGGIVKNLGCHSLDLALWLSGASGFAVKQRHVEWDGQTDRKAEAVIELSGVAGVAGQGAELRWSVSWLDAQSNQMVLQFENGSLICPLVPSETIEWAGRDRRRLALLQTASGGGAQTVGQACHLEWLDVFAARRTRLEPPASAKSTLLCAELMDELLA